MRQILLAILFTSLVSTNTIGWNSWPKTVVKVEQSLAYVSYPVHWEYNGEEGDSHAVCTGFFINMDNGYVLTARHCLPPAELTDTLTVNTQLAEVVWSDHNVDLAVLTSHLYNHPALKPSHKQLVKGLKVGALGYGYGMTSALLRSGYISHSGYDGFTDTGFPAGQIFFIFDMPYIGGMSGGPVFDEDGNVVSIVQLSDYTSGFGRPIDVILKATRQFWQYQ